MTELIVALDGPGPDLLLTASGLYVSAGVRWFKLGPQALLDEHWSDLVQTISHDANLFLDLKLADTADTVREAVKRFADAGIAAVSTYTERATETALTAAEGTNLRVWRVCGLSDEDRWPRGALVRAALCVTSAPSGIICPHDAVDTSMKTLRDEGWFGDIVLPGVRLPEDNPDGHRVVSTPADCLAAGADFAVVGRPIWQADWPHLAARRYRDALRGTV